MELVTIKNESLVSVPDPIAPLTIPIGEPPVGYAVSAGNAARLAENTASRDGVSSIAIMMEDNKAKNFLFIAVVGYLCYKYGRRFLNA